MSTILDSLKKSSDLRENNDNSSMDNFNFAGDKKSTSPKIYFFIVLFILILLAILYLRYDFFISKESGNLATLKAVNSEEIDSPAISKEIVVNEVTSTGDVKNPKIQKPNSSDVKQKIEEIKARKNKRRETLADLNKSVSSDVGTVISKTATANESKQKPLIKLRLDNKLKNDNVDNKTISVPQQKYPYIYQLPFNIRKNIPKLKLNIHVYDEEPENRIAIINGVRFSINEMIDDVVLLKDILVDGVLFEVDGEEFMLPN